jgi:putative ABC transport system permease protein
MTGDVLHMIRSIRRSPASAIAAVLTLSLTLGASASIFAVTRAVLLVPPPFRDPDALVTVVEVPIDSRASTPRTVTYRTFEAWRDRAAHLAAFEAADSTNLTMTGLGPAERLSVTDATPDFLALLGVTPVLGRGFAPEDLARPVVILSHGFWRAKFAGDPEVVGRRIVLGGQPHTIIGVLPEQFVYDLNPSEVWRPLPVTPPQAERGGYRVAVIARLSPKVPASALADLLSGVSRNSSPPARAAAVPIAAAIAGDARKTLWLLLAAAVLAMVLAFTNFAGLVMVRSIDRRRELAIRSALGARRGEMAKQLLLEALALVGVGVAAGVLLAAWLLPVVSSLALERIAGASHRHVEIDWQVIGAMVVFACAAACASVAAPAALALRRPVLDVLRRGTTSLPRETNFRRVLVAGQVALAFVLIACVTVLAGNLVRLTKVNPGFDPEGVLALQVSVPAAAYSFDRTRSFYEALQSALEQRLGRATVAVVNEIPLTADHGRALVSASRVDPAVEAVLREASPAYFDVMRIPVLAGRAFDVRDEASAPPRVVITAALAETLFPSNDAVGRSIYLTGVTQPSEVIGVVGDVKHRALDEAPLSTVYQPTQQQTSRSNIVVARSALPPAATLAVVREEVARLDASVPVYAVRSMTDVVAASPGMPSRRVLFATFMAFAILAVALSAIGLFGVVAHDVTSRQAELALRVALGADRARIFKATIGRGAVMLIWGLAAGGALSIWATRVLSSAGFGSGDVGLAAAGVAAVLLTGTCAAAIVPIARRAARTDPIVSLRSE